MGGLKPLHGLQRMTRRTRLRKAGRIAGYAGAGLVVLALVIAIGAPLYFRGERFGQLVERMLPEMRGHDPRRGRALELGHGDRAGARRDPPPLELDDITITDPEGTEVLHIEKRVGAHRGAPQPDAHHRPRSRLQGRALALRAHERREQGRVPGRVREPAAARPARSRRSPASSEFSIAGARLDGVEVTFDLLGLGPRAARRARASGRWRSKRTLFTFEVKDVDVRGGGRLRILGEKKRHRAARSIAARIDRVATTADDPDSIRLDASERGRRPLASHRARASSPASTASRPRRSSPASTSTAAHRQRRRRR